MAAGLIDDFFAYPYADLEIRDEDGVPRSNESINVGFSSTYGGKVVLD